MKVYSSYKVKIKHYNQIFKQTIRLYQDAITFFMDVCNREWDHFKELPSLKRCNLMEKLTIQTKKNPNPKYNFNECFYKMPVYLRRSAIMAAIGSYSSYDSNLDNWKKDEIGNKPTLQLDRKLMPALYNGNTFVKIDDDTAKIKVFHQNDWVWLTVKLRKQDVKYIQRHCQLKKEHVPTLQKVGKCYYLVFPYSEDVTLHKTDIEKQCICAVDLGLNHHAVCSIMQSDGTVIAKKFIHCAIEKDHQDKVLNRIKKAQQNGARRCPVLWKHANDINTEISRKTSNAIIDFASLYKVDTIIFEYLDIKGKTRGSKKQKLHLWRKKEIQYLVEHKAHILGMRISRICAWGTSKLAFDGSGEVLRGKSANLTTYSLCKFPNGKIYNCDLSASYNIGARYFIRELLKSSSVMKKLPSQTKESDYGTGSTRTLATLISLNADLRAQAA